MRDYPAAARGALPTTRRSQRDIARVTLGADAYTLRSLLNGEAAPALQIIQSPGANAIDVSN
ncbi:hypothetical protein MJL81_29195, partial [Salmonella enterica subsp. enterica serovar Anatum]|nr:hypothetical protein [Salmonella enterica subsp. enterica serovar Anatum]